jgi:hypothetical protein
MNFDLIPAHPGLSGTQWQGCGTRPWSRVSSELGVEGIDVSLQAVDGGVAVVVGEHAPWVSVCYWTIIAIVGLSNVLYGKR